MVWTDFIIYANICKFMRARDATIDNLYVKSSMQMRTPTKV